MPYGDKWLEVVVEEHTFDSDGQLIDAKTYENKNFKRSEWKQAVDFYYDMRRKYSNPPLFVDNGMVTIYEATYVGGENGWDYEDVTERLTQAYFESGLLVLDE